MPCGLSIAAGAAEYKALPNNTNSSWIRDPGLRKLNLGITLMFCSAASNGFDGGLINGLLALPYFTANVGNLSTNMEGLLIAGVALGAVPILIPASYLADRFGRKPCVAAGSSIMALGAIIQAVTNGHWAFFGTRFLIGVGLAFCQTSAPPLTTEIAHPRHRGLVTASFQAMWYWGSILSAVATLGALYMGNSWSWRLPCLLQFFFPTVQLLGLLIVPESPRYLVSRGSNQEALEMLARFHANGDIDDPLVRYEFDEITETLEAEKCGENGWSSFFKTKGNFHRFIICVACGVMIQWAGNGIVSFYLTPILKSLGITNATSQNSINLGLQIWNAICAMLGAWLAEKHGRRPLWLASTMLMIFFLSVVTILSAVFTERHISAAGGAAVAFLFLFFGSYDLAYTPLSIAYPVEILPFHLRAKGLSLNLTVVFVTVCLFVFAFIVYFLFPETKGRTLEEIAVVFDGIGAQPEAVRRLSVVTTAANDSVHGVNVVTKQNGTFVEKVQTL
ncbi:MAG: hypothetical protein M1834_001404 [Cirrosporium novae-zelandiae]|nr:MAG: hypothetical protein M1834_001404 [Cirrosporium novae-zelandiae]